MVYLVLSDYLYLLSIETKEEIMGMGNSSTSMNSHATRELYLGDHPNSKSRKNNSTNDPAKQLFPILNF